MSEKVKKKGGCLKWFLIVFGVIILIGACAAVLGGGDEDTGTSDKNDEESKGEVVGIGAPIKVGGAVFILNSVELADQVGPSALPTKASGKFVVIDVTYKNTGNEAVTLDASFFKLTRGEKTYESDSMASMSANQGENGVIQNSFFLQEVNPDMMIKGKVVFDLAPEVAEATDLQLQVQTGLFGTETGLINLK